MFNYFEKNFSKENFINIMQMCEKVIFSKKKNIISTKKDGSFVTSKDIEVDNIIYRELKKINPNVQIISEEKKYDINDFKKKLYWIIDPIDGTRDFIKLGHEYTVNIALVENATPIFGLIFHPPTKKIWIGEKNSLFLSEGYKKFKRVIKKKNIWNVPTLITSRHIDSKTSNYINNLKTKDILHSSSSIKFCMIAESKANLYFRLNKINKWDIAAGHAIVASVGGVVQSVKGNVINYCTPTESIDGFVAADCADWRKKVIITK